MPQRQRKFCRRGAVCGCNLVGPRAWLEAPGLMAQSELELLIARTNSSPQGVCSCVSKRHCTPSEPSTHRLMRGDPPPKHVRGPSARPQQRGEVFLPYESVDPILN
jgi:hypothetical protein